MLGILSSDFVSASVCSGFGAAIDASVSLFKASERLWLIGGESLMGDMCMLLKS